MLIEFFFINSNSNFNLFFLFTLICFFYYFSFLNLFFLKYVKIEKKKKMPHHSLNDVAVPNKPRRSGCRSHPSGEDLFREFLLKGGPFPDFHSRDDLFHTVGHS